MQSKQDSLEEYLMFGNNKGRFRMVEFPKEKQVLQYKYIMDECVERNVIVYDADCVGKNCVSPRLISLLRTIGRRNINSILEGIFPVDLEHKNYVMNELHCTLPTGCTNLVVAKFKNEKYLFGAY